MAIKVLIICRITGQPSARPDAALVSGLKRLGVEVDVMMPPGSDYIKIFSREGINVIPFHPVRKFDLYSIVRIRKEIKARSYNIIHLFNSKAILNGVIASLRLPVKTIAYRGAAGIYWYDPTAWFSHLNPGLDMVICNSKYVRNHIKKHLLFKRQKAVLVHKGMDVNWFNGVDAVSRKELGVPEDAILVGCVANYRREKGVRYLIEATYKMNPDLNVYFILMGKDLNNRIIRPLVKNSPFRDRIIFKGFRKDVYALVAACDIYVQPSLSESLSRSVMEAMCLKVPCVVSDVGGLRELIKHNKSGFIVRKADPGALAIALTKLAGLPEIRKQFATEAYERMRDMFSVEKMVKNTAKAYTRLIS